MLYEIDSCLRTNGGVVIAEGITAGGSAFDEWLRTFGRQCFAYFAFMGKSYGWFKHEPFGGDNSHIIEINGNDDVMTKLSRICRDWMCRASGVQPFRKTNC